MAHTFNPSSQEGEAEGLAVSGQHGVHRKTPSQNKFKNAQNTPNYKSQPSNTSHYKEHVVLLVIM